MSDLDAGALIARDDRLRAERAAWDSQWAEIADYILPRRADFNRQGRRGEPRTPRGFDSTAAWATEQLAAALHGLLTGPAAPWFQLRAQDDEADSDPVIRGWLDEAGRRMLQAFNSPKTGFQSQIHEVYLDVVAFGSGVLYVGEDSGGLRFSARHLAECRLESDADGAIEAVYRRFTVTAEQAVALWGAAVGATIRRSAEAPDAQARSHEILHAVFPRRRGALSAERADDMPWASVYVAVEDGHVIAESGYREVPYLTPRWTKAAGETYGRSPAMTALPDIRMIDAMARTIIQAAEKAAAPPLIVPDDGFVLPIRTSPNSLIFRRSGFGANDGIQPLQLGGRIDVGIEMMNRVRDHILRAFNVDWFNLAPAPGMTATEVVTRQQERLRLIGPMIGRLQTELLGPLVERVFAILLRRGAFGPPPDGIAGAALRIDYVSPVAQAQRYGELESLERLRRAAQELSAVAPDVLDNLDADAALRRTAAIVGAPAEALRASDDVRRRRAARAGDAP